MTTSPQPDTINGLIGGGFLSFALLAGMRPVRLARLIIDANVPYTAVGMSDLDFGALHPGPLRVVLEFRDHRRVGVALELAPGDARRLRLRVKE